MKPLAHSTMKQIDMCDNLLENLKDCTVFFITHRLSTIRRADRVMMHQGAIVESGTHDSLMSNRALLRSIPTARSRITKLLKRPSQHRAANKTLSHDETVLQQSRYWAQAITWGLISTTFLGVSWLAIAKTRDRCCDGQLEPIGSVSNSNAAEALRRKFLLKMAIVEAGELLIRLDTESSTQKLNPYKTACFEATSITTQRARTREIQRTKQRCNRNTCRKNSFRNRYS